MTVPRYTTVALPAYSYVPGRFPHPNADAAGHRFGRDLDGVDWFLVGVDLFNHGFYWEAHEAWERRWHALGRHGSQADVVKALIQLAVVGVKLRQQLPDAAAAHAHRAAELFRQAQRDLHAYAGLPLAGLAEQADQLAAAPPPSAANPPPVEVLFDLVLTIDFSLSD